MIHRGRYAYSRNRTIAAAGAMLVGLSGVAGAQQAQKPDDVLTALQALNRKIDRLQKDVDQLKAGGSIPTAAASPPSSTPAPAPSIAAPATPVPAKDDPTNPYRLKPGERFTGGWTVDAHGVLAQEKAGEVIGTFVADAAGFRFGEGRKALSFPSHAVFRGNAFYNAKESGRYVFIIRVGWDETIPNSTGVRCRSGLDYQDQKIITIEPEKFYSTASQAASRQYEGGVDLQEGTSPIKFEVACFVGNNNQDISPDMFIQNPGFRDWYDKIRFSILVKQPEAMKAERAAENELFHKTKARPARKSAQP